MKQILLVLSVSVLLLILFVSPVSMPATAAPSAAPTPVAAVDRGSIEPTLFNLWSAKAIAADTTTPCVEVTRYDVADIYYSIDQGTTNTLTLTLRFGNSDSALVDGIDVVASNAADASAMQQVQTFGKYMCILANVANSNPVTITVNALAK